MEATESLQTAEADTIDLCHALLRIDTSNSGGADGAYERPAAEYVAALLTDAGLTPQIVESAPGRSSVFARISGSEPDRDALLVHGHLDVVPAAAHEWIYPPFAGELVDGYLWGRGAVDMKDLLAMVLSLVRHWRRTGQRPRRDIVLAFLADEEAGSMWGAHWLVEHRPELFEGCTEAISEVGGFSWTAANGHRLYLVETAQKGAAWMRVTATGTAGHGSLPSRDNTVTTLARAIARIGDTIWPVRLTPPVARFLELASEALGVDLDPGDPEALRAALGSLERWILPTLSHTVSPTGLAASGGSVNVIPSTATGHLDGRYLPGTREEFLAEVRAILGDGIEVDVLTDEPTVDQPFAGDLVDRMVSALRLHDPHATAVPYCLSAGTDNTAFVRLGIRGYGFVPLQLPAAYDFGAMFHGVDERIPTSALRFGTRVLDSFLRSC